MTGYISKSAEDTLKVAVELSKGLKSGDVVALYGEMGVGKTVFARGIIGGLGYMGIVGSPTYTIVNEYMIDNQIIVHYDMYRVDDEETLEAAGYYENIERGAIVIVEWSEKVEYALPEKTKRIHIYRHDEIRSIVSY